MIDFAYGCIEWYVIGVAVASRPASLQLPIVNNPVTATSFFFCFFSMATKRVVVNPKSSADGKNDSIEADILRNALKRVGIDETAFLKAIEEERKEKERMDAKIPTTTEQTTKTGESQSTAEGGPRTASPGKLNTATSVVDLLKSLGEDSDFETRRSLSKDVLGTDPKDYKGSAKQNIALHKAIRQLGKEGIKKIKSPGSNPGIEDSLRRENIQDITPADEEDGYWNEYVAEVESSGERFVPPFSDYKRRKKNNV